MTDVRNRDGHDAVIVYHKHFAALSWWRHFKANSAAKCENSEMKSHSYAR